MASSELASSHASFELGRLRGDLALAPDASIVIPVNAKGDLDNVLGVVSDIAGYRGSHSFEVVLLVNNFEPGAPPPQIVEFKKMGCNVGAVSDVRRPGEGVPLSARIAGVRLAESETVLLFDADCRIPNADMLLDWYVDRFDEGADLAYTHVGYFDAPKKLGVGVYLFVHHATRWVKRSLLGIPTSRGSNYGADRDFLLEMYDADMLAEDMNVGPTFKAKGKTIAYSGRRALRVLTSGRMYTGSWKRMPGYFWYRLRYNITTLPVGPGAAARKGRSINQDRRYVDNQPVR